MIVRRFVVTALGMAIGACHSGRSEPESAAPPPSVVTRASTVTSAPAVASSAPPPDTRRERLAALEKSVRELPEVAERLAQDPEAKLVVDPASVAACDKPEPCAGYLMSVGEGPNDTSELVFIVDRDSGAISVSADRHAHFDREKPLSLSDWREEVVARRAAATSVVKLPEVAAWEKGLQAAGLDLAFWLDAAPPAKDCKAGADDCQWLFYVGEVQPDHTVRRLTVSVDRTNGGIKVAGLDGVSVPYAKWRTTRTAALMRKGK